MKVVKVADLKNNLSKHLQRVRRGEELTVLDRETPIARVVPFAHGSKDRSSPDRLADLVRAGSASPGDPAALGRWVDGHTPVRPPTGVSAVDLLLEMRRKSTR